MHLVDPVAATQEGWTGAACSGPGILGGGVVVRDARGEVKKSGVVRDQGSNTGAKEGYWEGRRREAAAGVGEWEENLEKEVCARVCARARECTSAARLRE